VLHRLGCLNIAGNGKSHSSDYVVSSSVIGKFSRALVNIHKCHCARPSITLGEKHNYATVLTWTALAVIAGIILSGFDADQKHTLSKLGKYLDEGDLGAVGVIGVMAQILRKDRYVCTSLRCNLSSVRVKVNPSVDYLL
jgi:hypothetical protein